MNAYDSKPRNYFVKVLEMIDKLVGIANPAANTVTELKILRKFFQERAQCWHIEPEVLKLLWHTDLEIRLFEKMRLPMPIMALEYDYDHALLGLPAAPEGRTECPRRCTILVDSFEAHRALIDQEQYEFLGQLLGDRVVEGIIIYQFFSDGGEWVMTPYVSVVPYQEMTKIAKEMRITTHSFKVHMRFSTLVPSMDVSPLAIKMGITSKDKGDILRSLAESNPMLDDIRVSFGLLQLLQCHNVPVGTVDPPAKLNQRRRRKKKVLLPSYRVLRITQPPVSAGKGGIRGTHASPRCHLRRGHIRRQWYPSSQTHNNKWIEPTFVGAGDPEIKDVEVK
mgnify:CR=1 FL=1